MERDGPPRTLTYAQSQAFYDRFAWLQDYQGFYENPALDVLVREADFGKARAVLELGCGTGRLAERLLAHELPTAARYVGLDSSAQMVHRTRRRLARFGARADIHQTDGSLRLPLPAGSYDRFLAAYVLDLLSETDLQMVLDEAHRILAPGGLLCLASLGPGSTWSSQLVCRAWSAVNSLAPALLGGCRPIEVLPLLALERWSVSFSRTVTAFAVPTHVLVVSRSTGP
jgi:ubiquinone/menaquinone biosynthesis C-methylase UbiE